MSGPVGIEESRASAVVDLGAETATRAGWISRSSFPLPFHFFIRAAGHLAILTLMEFPGAPRAHRYSFTDAMMPIASG